MAQTRSEKELAEVMQFYDYIEIQPLANYRFLVERNSIVDEARLKEILLIHRGKGRRDGKNHRGNQ